MATNVRGQNKLPFVLISPVDKPWNPRTHPIRMYSNVKSIKEIEHIWKEHQGTIYYDIETRGAKAHWDTQVMCAAYADERGAFCVDFTSSYEGLWEEITYELWRHDVPLAVFNISFEGAFALRDNPANTKHIRDKWPNFVEDVFSTYRYLANEGFDNQKWGLKPAQLQLLGWDAKGDVELDQWMIDNGYYTMVKNKRTGEREPRAKKAEMWRAPFEILGHYCALDAISTMYLSEYVFQPVRERFKLFTTGQFTNIHLTVCREFCIQQIEGMYVNRENLEAYHAACIEESEYQQKLLCEIPQVQEFCRVKKQKLIQELEQAEPVKYKKQKELRPPPAQFTKTGKESKSYLNWLARKQEIENTPPEQTINWGKWREKMDTLINQPLNEFFNPNSSQDKAALLFDHCNYPVHEFTKEGNPATGKGVLGAYGEIGNGLLKAAKPAKVATYVSAWLENSSVDGKIHLQTQVVASVSGRTSGGASD